MKPAYCGKCDLVGDLKFSQEGAPQTHQSVFETSRNINQSIDQSMGFVKRPLQNWTAALDRSTVNKIR